MQAWLLRRKRLLIIKGIDLSRHQKAGKVNFNELKNAGYEFVILRAGYGKYPRQKDPAFEAHYKGAKEAGLFVGAYHYSYALTVADAIREADCFLAWIGDKKLDYPVAFDIEDKTQKLLTTKQRTDIALAFMERVENAGYYTMLYSSANWLERKLDRKRLEHFDVWLACYTDEEKRKKLYSGKFGIWQRSSILRLPKVYNGRLDENLAYKDYAKIIKRAGLNKV